MYLQRSKGITQTSHECPHPSRQSRSRRRSRSFEAHVMAAKAIPNEAKRERRAKIRPFLGEPACQTNEPPRAHPHRQILPYKMQGADPVLVWVGVDGRGESSQPSAADCSAGHLRESRGRKSSQSIYGQYNLEPLPVNRGYV